MNILQYSVLCTWQLIYSNDNVSAVGFGLLTIGLSYATEYGGSGIVQLQLSIYGVIQAPIFGVFVLAFFVPFANAWVSINIIGIATNARSILQNISAKLLNLSGLDI